MTAVLVALALCWLIYKSLPPGFSPQLIGFPEGWDGCIDRPERKPWKDLILWKKDAADPPAADPRIGEAAVQQAQTGQEWLDFAKTQFDVGNKRQEDTDALNKQVIQQQMGIADQQNQWAQSDRDRYENTFKPIEDQFISQATNYDTPEKQAEAAAEAKADVLNNAQASTATNQRQMAALGINPTSGRFAGIERATDLDTALASAGAQNNARQMVRDKGLALKADVANLGRGLPAQSAQATQIGLGAGQGAVGVNQSGNNNFYQNQQGMNQGFGGAMQGYAGQASTLNNLYNSQLSAWSTQQQASASNSAGLMSGIGTIAGAGIMAF